MRNQRQHPDAEVAFIEDNGDHIGIDQTLLEIRCKEKQPRIGCKNGHTGHARGFAQHRNVAQPHPNGALCSQQQTRVLATILGWNEQREKNYHHERTHPQHVVGDTGLVGQQDTDAQDGGRRCKHRIFAQVKGKGEIEHPGVDQRQSCDEEGHGGQHIGHQARPGHAADDEVGGGEGQRQQHQLSERITGFCTMGCNRHQGANHTQRNGDGPEAGFAQTDGVDGLTEPVLVVNERRCHRGVGGSHHAEKKEERQIVLDRKQRERQHGPVVGQGVNAHPQIRHGNAQTRQVP